MLDFRKAPIEKNSAVHPWDECYKSGKPVLPAEKDMQPKWFDRAQKRLSEKESNEQKNDQF